MNHDTGKTLAYHPAIDVIYLYWESSVFANTLGKANIIFSALLIYEIQQITFKKKEVKYISSNQLQKRFMDRRIDIENSFFEDFDNMCISEK